MIMRNQRGSISIFAIILLLVLIPLGIYVAIEYPKNLQVVKEAGRYLAQATTAAVETAVEVKVKDTSGRETISYTYNEDFVNYTVNQYIAAFFNTRMMADGGNYRHIPSEQSIIKEIKTVRVHMYDSRHSFPKDIVIDGKTRTLHREGILVEMDIVIKKLGMIGRDTEITLIRYAVLPEK